MISVRVATSTDAEALASLSGQLGYPADAAAVLRRMGGGLIDHGVVLVAVDPQGAVCGFAHAEPRCLLIAEPFVELAALVVSDNGRGSGAGATLLAAVETWTREHGIASVRVRSNVLRERAHRFYLRGGYIEKKRQAVFLKRLQARDERT
ncbi:MAG TPA: GNAT family N-acetyltransferase [Rhodanobacteraceae bacterium]|nr:GNAT family N-acetyltransferase [Rhodanobacteraceae bacterium]